MGNIILILIIVIATLLHWHYYRWKIFNPWVSNTPEVYRSNTGTLFIFITKIVLFGYIVLFFDWYLIFTPFFLLLILKFIAYYKSFKFETKEFFVFLGNELLIDKGIPELNETERPRISLLLSILFPDYYMGKVSKVKKDYILTKITNMEVKEITKRAKENAENAILKNRHSKIIGIIFG